MAIFPSPFVLPLRRHKTYALLAGVLASALGVFVSALVALDPVAAVDLASGLLAALVSVLLVDLASVLLLAALELDLVAEAVALAAGLALAAFSSSSLSSC